MCRIAICDDDRYFVEQLKDYIVDYSQKKDLPLFLKTYTDSDELMESVLGRIEYDLYILDIMMPEYTGMDFLSVLEEQGTEAEVILLTSYTGYAIEACSHKNVFRYILKEELPQRMESVLDSFYREMGRKEKRRPYIIQNRMKCIKIYQEDVVFICREGKYVVFTLKDGRKEKERGSLSEVYTKLSNPDMQLLDRSYIVNISHVTRICRDEVWMDTEDILRTNHFHIQRLKEYFTAYWGELL